MSLAGTMTLLGEPSGNPKESIVIEALCSEEATESGSGRSQVYLNQTVGWPDGRKLAVVLGFVPGKESEGDPGSWAAFPSNFGTIRVIGKAELGAKVRIEITPGAQKRESSTGNSFLFASGVVMAGNGHTLRVNYYEPIPKLARKTGVSPQQKQRKAA